MFSADMTGLVALSPTPFQDNGQVDEHSIGRLMDFYAQAGCSGVMMLGIMGEADKLDHSEAVAVAKCAIAHANGLPIGVGVSAPGFAMMKSLAKEVMSAGAAGVMIAPPSSLKTDSQIVAYYQQAVEAIGSDVPFVIQDFPRWTGVVMTVEVIRKIVQMTSSCVMVKHEDLPGLDKLTTLRENQKDGLLPDISILAGNGGIFLDFELDRGADGAMTGYCFSDAIVEIIRSARSGDRDHAHDLYDAHLPLLRYEHQGAVGLAVRKYILKRRGVLASPKLRSPGHSLSQRSIEEVDYLLRRLARHDERAAALLA